MASITEWETYQLQHIHVLLQKASRILQEFKKKEDTLRSIESLPVLGTRLGATDGDEETINDWFRFRDLTYNLYSVLDYTYFLLRSHFANNGDPDHSEHLKSGFPYKRKGVKFSNNDNQDQRKKFVSEKLKFLFADKLGEGTHFWKDIGNIILSVQPMLFVGSDGLPVDEQGQPTDDDTPKIKTLDQTSCALLHYFRNYTTHRDLIHFLPEKSWIEINQTTREIKLVKEYQQREGFYYYVLEKGYWIHLPEDALGTKQDDRFLLEVLHQLFEFVKRITSKLLSSALFLTPRDVLENYFDGHLEVSYYKIAAKTQAVCVMTLYGGRKFTINSDPCEQPRDAEQHGCIQLFHNMINDDDKVLPKAPYTYLTPCPVHPFPHVTVSRQINYRVLMNAVKQILIPKKLQVIDTNDGPHTVDNKIYSTITLCVTDVDGNILLKLSSHKHEKVHKNKGDIKELEEAAVKEVMEECLLLGVIEYK